MTWPLPSNGLSEVGSLSRLVNHTREPVAEYERDFRQLTGQSGVQFPSARYAYGRTNKSANV
jgi:hypothetical protein